MYSISPQAIPAERNPPRLPLRIVEDNIPAGFPYPLTISPSKAWTSMIC
ncbi:MAG: hypothetical protein ABIQ90_02770 [Polaromonas sp.]